MITLAESAASSAVVVTKPVSKYSYKLCECGAFD
jgi:hypothetical protein